MRTDISISSKIEPALPSLLTGSSHGAGLPPQSARISAVKVKPEERPSQTIEQLKARRLRNLSPERAHEELCAARTADLVYLFLRDGRVYDGAILFNEFKSTGRLINIDREISVDFRAEDVRDIRY